MNCYEIMYKALNESNTLLEVMMNHNINCHINESTEQFSDEVFKSNMMAICKTIVEEATSDKYAITGIDKSVVESSLDFEGVITRKLYQYNNDLPTIKEYVDLCIEAVDKLIYGDEAVTEASVEVAMTGIHKIAESAHHKDNLLNAMRGDIVEHCHEYMSVGERFERLSGLIECVDTEECKKEFTRLIDFIQENVCNNESLTLGEKGDCIIGVMNNAANYYLTHQKAFKEAVMQEKSIISELLQQKETKLIVEEIANDNSIAIF